MRKFGASAVLFVLVCGAGVRAGEYNKALNIGDEAPAWVDLPGVDGKKHSLADLKNSPMVVVLFTCNSCAVAVDYEDRIIAFAKKYSGRVAVVAINVNRIEADKLPKMQERAKEKEFNFAYVYDESQKIAKLYGATYTPEFIVLDKARKVAYMGAMDDKSPPAKPTTTFLEQAVDALLKDAKPPLTETLARGCKVRYIRPR